MAIAESVSWDCNPIGSPTRSDGLLPGWCIQTATDGVTMWCDKRVFVLKLQSAPPKSQFVRVRVQRTLGTDRVENFDFVVEARRDYGPVTWCAGTDTGSIKVTAVEPCAMKGALDAVHKLEIVDDHRAGGLIIKELINHSPHYVFASVEMDTSGNPSKLAAAVVIAGFQRRDLIDAFGLQTTNRWQAAEYLRADLYGPWPP
ncbi:hypothetical protein CCOS865_04139 [Pseudomonas reidholzensis]|uniref:Uncharacterized protein n=1 Tax=Pseudomonas reidholzensis TaxID=1785162 RepID=A0A383RXS5_9PSED|nr:hypothetical protein [Pseudomonas reidholzensis]SYX91859.1 hypothetical protein CCOS865_04139 [Pseudomonas reidholzensis]